MGVSLDVKGEACGNDFHESMQVNVSQCKSMYDGQDTTWDGGGEASDGRGEKGGSGDATAAARRMEMPVTCSAGAERR